MKNIECILVFFFIFLYYLAIHKDFFTIQRCFSTIYQTNLNKFKTKLNFLL